ncbi:hypothetical protein GF345_04300 [Candidatus Woesearchaeota archaeon]|nr:hypothetical protein [Candidatus Woesearchaeota archaeon]
MGLGKKIFGAYLAVIGFILSPLSWWNDLFVNIPIAYAFAYLSAFISRSLFVPMFLIIYLLTNVAGFMLMHKGAEQIAEKESRWGMLESLAVSVFYMIIVILLMLFEIVPIPEGV